MQHLLFELFLKSISSNLARSGGTIIEVLFFFFVSPWQRLGLTTITNSFFSLGSFVLWLFDILFAVC